MAAHEFDDGVVRRFREGGAPQGMTRERLLLLTTTGRRSGASRTSPMMFVRDGGDPVVIASNDGAAAHPDWYRNAIADPAVEVETPDGRRWRGTADELQGAERERVWTALVADFPFFAEHQRRAGDRRIPLVRLRPV